MTICAQWGDADSELAKTSSHGDFYAPLHFMRGLPTTHVRSTPYHPITNFVLLNSMLYNPPAVSNCVRSSTS